MQPYGCVKKRKKDWEGSILMKMTTFAAIDIGAYDVTMKVFEFSNKNGMRELDCIRQRIELGADTYSLGYIGMEKTERLCRILTEFRHIMESYRVDVYRACAKSALRETSNILLVLDQIRSKTGFQVEVLSNSEHRFISYKSIAFQEKQFLKMIEKPTAILDVGEGSVQISLFNKECLVTTQNIRLGTMRLREKLSNVESWTTDLVSMIDDLLGSELRTFRKLYMKEKEIKHLIILGQFLPNILKKAKKEPGSTISREELLAFFEHWQHRSAEQLAEELELPMDTASLAYQTMLVYQSLIRGMDVEMLWAPALSLCEGLAYEYAETNKYLKSPHNFENDILAAGKVISKRYQCNSRHAQAVQEFALAIFDGLKQIHGMGKRERLLLQLTALLHNCGKYISMSYSAQSTYNIIASTEIIGLSHTERAMVACVAKYNSLPFPDYAELSSELTREEYLVVAKLTAILRLANEFDRGHKQKFVAVKATLKNDQLTVVVDALQSMALEIGMMMEKKKFFEDIFGVTLTIRQKKRMS